MINFNYNVNNNFGFKLPPLGSSKPSAADTAAAPLLEQNEKRKYSTPKTLPPLKIFTVISNPAKAPIPPTINPVLSYGTAAFPCPFPFQTKEALALLPITGRDIGCRTPFSREFLHGFKEYSSDPDTLNIKKQLFRIINSELRDFNTRTVSCGSHVSREIISFDPATLRGTSALWSHFTKLKSILMNLPGFKMGMHLPPGTVVREVNDYVKKMLTFSEEEVAKFVQIARTSSFFPKLIHNPETETECPVPVIPLEFFVKRGIGICRHSSFIVEIFCDLIKKLQHQDGTPILKGDIIHMRGEIKGELHAWTVFIPETSPNCPQEYWLIDATRKVIYDFSDAIERRMLEALYGASAVKLIVEQTEKAIKSKK